jgi:hypothetical protein
MVDTDDEAPHQPSVSEYEKDEDEQADENEQVDNVTTLHYSTTRISYEKCLEDTMQLYMQ